MAILFLENLVKTYRGRKVVDQVELKVETGSVVGLLGPNGAGKTTTFFMAVGMIKANGGRILLDEEDITDTVIFLLKNKFITGQVIYVDGGRHLKGSFYGC